MTTIKIYAFREGKHTSGYVCHQCNYDNIIITIWTFYQELFIGVGFIQEI